MNDTTTRIEPVIAAPFTAPASPPANAPERSALDQLSRIEDKAARIEEKFARYEAVFGRAQASIDAAAARVEVAAKSVDAVELAQEVALLRARVEKTPRFAALITAALAGAAASAGGEG